VIYWGKYHDFRREKSMDESTRTDYIERTLVILKPDAVQRGIVGEILQRFERVGLKIVGMKMVSPDQELFKQHYEGIGKLISRRGEETYRYKLEDYRKLILHVVLR